MENNEPLDLTAHEAYRIITSGLQCASVVLSMLDRPTARRVETALAARQIGQENGLDMRDALHRFNGANDSVKADVADFLTPEHAGDWRGSVQDKMAARDAANDRERWRMEDRVLENVLTYAPDDHGLDARQCREAAASIRDHRENHHRRLAWGLADEEMRLNEQALAAFAERDELRAEAERLQEEKDWTAASVAAIAMRKADDIGTQLVHRQIQVGNQRKEQVRLADQYREANLRYEASGTYVADQTAREGDR